MQKSQIIALSIATSLIIFLALSHGDLHKLNFHEATPYVRGLISLFIGVLSNMFFWKWQKNQQTEEA